MHEGHVMSSTVQACYSTAGVILFSLPLSIHQLCGGGYHIYDSYTFVGFVDKTQTIMCSILGRKL